MSVDTDRYLDQYQHVAKMKDRLRPFILSDRKARLIFDPRETEEEPVEGWVEGASSATDMLALWVPTAEAEYTLHRRTPMKRNGEEGYLLSYEIVTLLDVEPI